MREYLCVIVAVLFFSWAIDKTRFGQNHTVENRVKNNTLHALIFLVLTLFLGLRTTYNDTLVYLSMYNKVEVFPDFWDTFDPHISEYPGFMIVQAFLRSHDISGQGFLLFFSFVAMACVLAFLKKCSCNYTLSLFLLFATNMFTFFAAAMKQVTAISIGLIAILCALKQKWFAFAVLIFVASLFHPYSVLFGLVPLLMFRPWGKLTYILLGGAFLAGLMLESILGTIVDITAMIGDVYEEEDLIGEGINVFRVLVANVPLFLTFLYRKTLFRDSTRVDHLMINLTMLNGAIMFVGLFGNSIYFSRMASYFTIFQCISLPWILNKLPRQRRAFFTGAMIAGYAGFFVYANMISQSFDSNFSRITLWQYLSEYVFK